ncbi:ABC transporter ATP-binding protein/permease [Candidatus Pelagibacter sp.]|nr:ABC transporter ATP-binding protein/permease [Candidatus Pelagibacter sp.]
MQSFRKLLYFLTPSERKNAAFLLLMILIMALIDTLGVASILPFMAVLTSPDIIETNKFLNIMFQKSKIFGIENNQDFIFVLGLSVFLLLVLSLSMRATTAYFQIRFVQMREYSISKRLVEGYLNQPYSWFLNRHSADIGKNILSEVSGIIGSGIKPILEIIAKGIVAISIITLLVLTNPKLAFIVGFSLGSTYIIIFYFIKNYLNKIGKKRFISNELRFKSIMEAFGAAKEVKLGRLEEIYIKRFSDPAYIYAKSQSSAFVFSQFPRFILEAVAFGGVLLLILFMMRQSGNFNSALPILSLYVFAGYRLMPALQQIYSAFTQVTFIGPALEKLYEEIKSLKTFDKKKNNTILPFNKEVSLKEVNYNYPNSSRTALKNINLNIPVNSKVGLVGTTGSGKTTTVDIILGLLEPQKGTLEVDGQIITKDKISSWQKYIGYVPQHIYLADDTVASNIAFGVQPDHISMKAIEKASKIANLHEFVINELPKKYETTIGERGIRLSGGQRQRIGIARALYHNPNLLILDEATSALDNQTEKAVMDAVNNLKNDRTIIIIAHRLSTVKNCDKIFMLDKGQLKHEGTFEELLNTSDKFRMNANN